MDTFDASQILVGRKGVNPTPQISPPSSYAGPINDFLDLVVCILLHVLLLLIDIAPPEVHLDENDQEAEEDVPSDDPMDTKSNGVLNFLLVMLILLYCCTLS